MACVHEARFIFRQVYIGKNTYETDDKEKYLKDTTKLRMACGTFILLTIMCTLVLVSGVLLIL